MPRETSQRSVEAKEDKLTGFVFKIHANLDPNHRDRIAFLRICSGKLERNKKYYHTRLKKQLRFANPTQFMANEKSIIEDAFPGDVVGLYDSGTFKIGDTLTEGEDLQFRGIPSFSPEIFREVINKDPLRSKQLDKGVYQLMDEGVAQLFIQQPGNRKIIGTVGELQFDVIKFRLEHEYGAQCIFQNLNYFKAYWVTSNDPKELADFVHKKSSYLAMDKEGAPVFLAESEWALRMFKDTYPGLIFHTNSEFKTAN
jgi:peptide chain release factor 3